MVHVIKQARDREEHGYRIDGQFWCLSRTPVNQVRRKHVRYKYLPVSHSLFATTLVQLSHDEDNSLGVGLDSPLSGVAGDIRQYSPASIRYRREPGGCVRQQGQLYASIFVFALLVLTTTVFNGTYYLYGNSFSVEGVAFGIKSYSSVDLEHWYATRQLIPSR